MSGSELPAGLEPVLPVHVLHLFPEERRLLLDLLTGLGERDWEVPTVCPGWSIKDVALHLLGDDVGRLAARDGFRRSTFRPAPGRDCQAELLDFVNAQNELWVQATRRISSPFLCDLLRVTGEETRRYFESLDLFAMGGAVSWAGPDPAPVWLDIAREYTERWLHHRQIRDALGAGGLTEPHLFAPVIDTFVRALPHTFHDVDAPAGTQVRLKVTGEAGGEWSLVKAGDWRLYSGVGPDPRASVTLDADAAWRLFTRGLSKEEALARTELGGERRLALRVLDTVSIIA